MGVEYEVEYEGEVKRGRYGIEQTSVAGMWIREQMEIIREMRWEGMME